MNNFVKQAYVQGLAARAILRARIMQKQAGGVKDYAMAGGIGAGGGALVGALVNYARKKNMLHGALAGAGIGGVAGLGYQGIKDLMSKKDTGSEGQPFNAMNARSAPGSNIYNPLADLSKAEQKDLRAATQKITNKSNNDWRVLAQHVQQNGYLPDDPQALLDFASQSDENRALIARNKDNIIKNVIQPRLDADTSDLTSADAQANLNYYNQFSNM